MKVYCNNCKYFENNFGHFKCNHPNNLRKEDGTAAPVFIQIAHPYLLNANNDCRRYRKKWWKFWIPRRRQNV